MAYCEKYYFNVGDHVYYLGKGRSQRKAYIKSIWIENYQKGLRFLLATMNEGEVIVKEDRLLGVIPRDKILRHPECAIERTGNNG